MGKNGNIILGIIQLFIAIGPIPAGYLFLIAPDGTKMGMPSDLLSGSVFSDYLIPGLFLFIVIGLFNLISAIFSFIKSKYYSFTGFGLGAALIIWISVQIYILGLTYILQPVFLIIGIIEISLSLFLYKTKTREENN